jgi:hypothetical protein
MLRLKLHALLKYSVVAVACLLAIAAALVAAVVAAEVIASAAAAVVAVVLASEKSIFTFMIVIDVQGSALCMVAVTSNIDIKCTVCFALILAVERTNFASCHCRIARVCFGICELQFVHTADTKAECHCITKQETPI